MIYREVHPSWMAMRGKQHPNNTSASVALGPFNLREIVAHGSRRGYLSRHWTIQSNSSLSIGPFRGFLRDRVEGVAVRTSHRMCMRKERQG